jgi:hypothetical protein
MYNIIITGVVMKICAGCKEQKELYRDLRFCRDCNNENIRKRLNIRKNRRCLYCDTNFININRFSICSTKCNIMLKIEFINGCWIWKGSFRGAYGTMSYKGKSMSCHKVSYLVFKGEVPKGMCVCHTCDNQKCVNPDHLWLGTYKENTQDMIAKGRSKFYQGVSRGDSN